MLQRTLLAIAIVLLPLSYKLAAQDAPSLLEQAVKAYQSGDYTKAANDYTAAARLFEQTKTWDAYLECGVGLANSQRMSGDMNAALVTLDAYITIGEQSAAQSEQLAFLYKGKGAVYYAQNNYRQAEQYLKKALDVRQKVNPNNTDLVREHGNLGQIYRLLNDYKQSIKHLEKALVIAQKNNLTDANIISFLQENIGISLMQMGNYAEALDYFNAALKVVGDNNAERKFTLLTNKGKTLFLQKNTKESIKEFRKSLNSYGELSQTQQQDVKNQVGISALFDFFAQVFKAEGNLDSAQIYYLRALEVAKKHLSGTEHEFNHYINLAEVCTDKKDYSQAQKYLTEAEKMLPSLEPKSQQISSFFQAKSVYHKATGNYALAFQAVQAQISALIEGYEAGDIESLPSEAQLEGAVSLDMLTDALAYKARVFYDASIAGRGKQKELEIALQACFLFDKAVDKFREQSNAEGTGLSWSELTLDAYANAMDICWALWQTSKEAKYKEHAFYFSEKSKALVLLEAFQRSKATKMSGLSESDVERERSLKMRISEQERTIHQLKQDRKNLTSQQDKIAALEKAVFEDKRAYDALLKELSAKHPQYYQMKHAVQIAGIEQVRAMLLPDQALLEYFVADSSVYVFKITASELEWYPIALQEKALQSQVRSLRTSIYEYYLSAERTDALYASSAAQYAKDATALYQQLLGVAAPLPRRLLIIPAGNLSDLPFDALLMETPAQATQYSSHAYLLRKHITSYCYSATLLQEMKGRIHQPTSGSLLAFAPEFGSESAAEVRGERFALSPLAFNVTEVEKIAALVGGSKVLKGKEAIEPTFHQLAAQYRILHFATHGMARDKDPDFSLLAFTEIADTAENEFLYVRELYDMELNADLVVLSACETGIGKLFRGEGIVSLARGFSYAGAKSIFTTLWSVNDQATSQIIASFYTYLAAGKDKDEALFMAKNDFLQNGNSATAHPFLWAPFIVVGDMSAMDGLGSNGIAWWVWVLAAAAFALVALLWLRRRKER